MAYRSGEPIWVRNVDRDERIHFKTKARQIGFLSGIIVRLIQDKRAYGVLKMYAARTDQFDERDQHFLEVAAFTWNGWQTSAVYAVWA